MGTLEIGTFQLVLCLIFVLMSGLCSLLLSLKLERDILVGTVRTFAQLFLMGYTLRYVFEFSRVWVVLLLFSGMIGFAAWTIRGRVKERTVPFFRPTLISMLITYTAVTAVVTGVIVQARPWYLPQYFIPLGGMVVGNSMTAIAVSLDRLFGDLRSKRQLIETMLCLGADYREATHEILREAVRAGMIPTINSMMAVGIVFLPGMMTGQILGGTDPVLAIKYQIVVMLMLTASTAAGSILVTFLVRRRCFTAAQQLIIGAARKEGSRPTP